jgi:hypothetical protein
MVTQSLADARLGFDVRSGKARVGSGQLGTFDVRIDGNEVLIKNSGAEQ